MEYGIERHVTAVQGISLASHPKAYGQEVWKMALDVRLSFVTCPTALIDHRRTEGYSVRHNAITPDWWDGTIGYICRHRIR